MKLSLQTEILSQWAKHLDPAQKDADKAAALYTEQCDTLALQGYASGLSDAINIIANSSSPTEAIVAIGQLLSRISVNLLSREGDIVWPDELNEARSSAVRRDSLCPSGASLVSTIRRPFGCCPEIRVAETVTLSRIRSI